MAAATATIDFWAVFFCRVMTISLNDGCFSSVSEPNASKVLDSCKLDTRPAKRDNAHVDGRLCSGHMLAGAVRQCGAHKHESRQKREQRSDESRARHAETY